MPKKNHKWIHDLFFEASRNHRLRIERKPHVGEVKNTRLQLMEIIAEIRVCLTIYEHLCVHGIFNSKLYVILSTGGP